MPFIVNQLAFPSADKGVEWLAGFEGLVYVAAGSGCATTVPTATALLDCKNSVASF